MSKPVLAILVHGFNVWDGGRATVGKLRPFLSARDVPYIMINYGHVGLLRTGRKNKKIAGRLAKAVRTALDAGQRPVVIGHSNGCAIIHLAMAEVMKGLLPVDNYSVGAVYINPALGRGLMAPAAVHCLDVWFSPSDKPVRWSKWLPRSNARPWGEMGATGFVGVDKRVRNHNKELMSPSSKSHSDMFSAELLPFYGPLLAGNVVGEW
ncbi:MAG: alpha/beta fold hydrolase [Candidatus Reddybacter sp.]